MAGGGYYERVEGEETLNPERGYWVHCPVQSQTLPVSGAEADGLIELQPGWNAVSPVCDCLLPDDGAILGPAWAWDAQQGDYDAVRPGGLLQAGKAYWIYVGQAGCTLQPGTGL